jgi:hypothetical protein
MFQNRSGQYQKKTRIEILKNLKANLPDKNLFDLAHQFNIPIENNGKKNKGWVGQTVEKLAGLSLSNSQSPDGIDCELKTTTLVSREGKWIPKETIKITQLNPKNILQESFETSVLWKKLSRLVFVGVNHVSLRECYAVQLGAIDLLSPQLVEPIKNFWEDVQHNILSGDMLSFYNLGSSEELIQLRPVGDGKLWSVCPITGEKFPARAFYATKNLIEQMMATTSLDCLS